MSTYETAASIEAAQDAKQAAEEDRALRPEPVHATTVKAIRRRTHEIERIVLVVRCNGCKYRLECDDEVRAHREALRHEATQTPAGGHDRQGGLLPAADGEVSAVPPAGAIGGRLG